MRTIEDLKKDKEDLAKKIREAISDFEKKNPDAIAYIEVESMTERDRNGLERIVYYRVNINVNI